MLGVQTKRRGDDDGVKVTRFKQATMIPVDRRLLSREFSRRCKARLVYVAKPSHAHAGNSQEITHQLLPATAGADNSEADLVRWRDRERFPDASDATADDGRAQRAC